MLHTFVLAAALPLWCLLALALIGPGPVSADQGTTTRSTLLSGHHRKVRPQSDDARDLLADAVERSPTVRALVASLEATDVIVFLQRLVLPRDAGRTSLLSSTAEARLVRVVINTRLVRDRAIEMLGHELQHVSEIAVVPAIRTEEALGRHLTSVGIELSGGGFETDAARRVESQVRRDLLAALRK